ncbi:MAG: hypothetical protein KA186_05310, partial [Flavobacteriales bacterium]|nr:hypothetical protein [Flavobacteriales bacterium]
MNLVRQDFLLKVEEVQNYFLFLELIEEGGLVLTENVAGAGSTRKEDLWLKTLKASFYLVVYNLI